jgi:hypothetical protein
MSFDIAPGWLEFWWQMGCRRRRTLLLLLYF